LAFSEDTLNEHTASTYPTAHVQLMALTAMHVVLLVALAGSMASADRKPVDPIPQADYENTIRPIIKYIVNGTIPKSKNQFLDLLGPYGPLPGLQTASFVLQWHEVLLGAVRAYSGHFSYPTAVARALFIVQSAVYDTWAAYNDTAIGVYWDTSIHYRRSSDQRTDANRKEAISFAAYHATANLFPNATELLQEVLVAMNYSISLIDSTDPSQPAGLGHLAAKSVIETRLKDESNQENNYKDTTKFVSLNTPDKLCNASAWQPLRTSTGMQEPVTPQWRHVTPFALKRANQFVPPADATFLANTEDYDLQANTPL
jgi:hypothetical protein